MAKKKQTRSRSRKTSRRRRSPSRKSARVQPAVNSSFWPLAGGILLLVLALFFLLGSIGSGGPLPISLFHGAQAVLGWAASIVFLALAYWGVAKFASEDHHLQTSRLASLGLALLFAAAWLDVTFAKHLPDGSWQAGHGGSAGHLLGAATLSALNKVPASILFIVLVVLATLFAVGLSPKILAKPFARKHKDDDEAKPVEVDEDEPAPKKRSKLTEITDLAMLKSRAPESKFELNAGVPVEDYNDKQPLPRPAHSTFKNTAKKPAEEENQEALTAANDTEWQYPGIDLLEQKQDKADAGDVKANAQAIHDTLANFKIEVDVTGANVGPRLTQYTLKPPTGVKLTKITALENNLALDLAARSIRIEAPIPGQRAVGIEVPNKHAATVRVGGLLQSPPWKYMKSPLGFVVGQGIAGAPVVEDLGKMPHLLVAGQTGSGKSVMINTILTSLLYRNSPSDLKLILVDPKRVEMAPYADIPHLLTPVIVEPDKCISALKWTVAEMERRYKELSAVHKRNIEDYNSASDTEHMPYIVIIIDELADLMMMAARDVEALIVRIAAKARAVGIHLILATQSPRVDVITGLIKNNVPARIAFAVPGQVDSRVMIDSNGAEKLLGQGDMLFKTSELPKPIRVQGAFISSEETAKLVDFLKMQREPQYNDDVVSQPVQLGGKGSAMGASSTDDADEPVFRDAVQVGIDSGKLSTSLLQRKLRIGYGKAARIIEQMEDQGIVGPSDGNRPREVLVTSMDQVFGGGEDFVDEPDTEDSFNQPVPH